MNKLFDESKISTFRDLKDLATGNKLVGRREIIIGIDERAIEELRNYVYKAEMYDEKDKEIERLNNIINKIRNAFNDKNIYNNMELVKRIEELVELKEQDNV